HAEVLALRAAAARLGDGWRLTGCTITVTLEPCAMCAGAIMAARLARVEFGAFEPKTGACGSRWDLLRDRASPLPAPEVRGGVLAEEAARPLRGFFSKTNNSGRFPG
ncbi:nucleoside deaminase, partial [Corynebacterium otitidis]